MIYNTWKWMNGGMVAKRDETEAIATVHVCQGKTKERTQEIRDLIINAPDVAMALRDACQMLETHGTTIPGIQGILAEWRRIAGRRS